MKTTWLCCSAVFFAMAVLVSPYAFSADAPGAAAPAQAAAPSAAAPAPSSSSVVIGNAAAPVVKKAEESLPAIVAKVGDETITGKEFGKQIDFYQKTMEGRTGSAMELDERQRYEFLQYAVEERLLEVLAKKEKLAASDEEAKAELDKAKAKAGSEQAFKDSLAQMGFTEEDALALMRSNLTKSKLVDMKTKDLAIGDEELKAEYEKFKAAGQMDRPETYNVSHVLIKVDGKDEAEWTKGKEAIDAALKRVKGGEDFAAVAKAVSQDPGSADKGGSYKDVQTGQMVPAFDQMMQSTPVGQVSEPFRTSYGWHFLKVDAKNAAGTMELASIKDDLSKYLLKKKKDTAVQKLVEEGKASVKIEILLPKPPPEAAPAAGAAGMGAPAEQAAPAAAAPAAAAPAAAAPAAGK